MDFFSSENLDSLNKIYRINLVNSITGYKSANLIGSISNKGAENLAIFSSITHLGSNPALLSLFVRPNVVPRNTYKNIKEKKVFTVNHISKEKSTMLITLVLNMMRIYPNSTKPISNQNTKKLGSPLCKRFCSSIRL